MVGEISYGTEERYLSYHKSRLRVCSRPSSESCRHDLNVPGSFLDTVTTDIIHYESKKVEFSHMLLQHFECLSDFHVLQLVYYPGNLSSFVSEHPEAKSYYTLAATSVKFSFPPPGSLMGVRSQTRAILKMTNCTYTYPGRPTPSLYNISCALTLSRCGGFKLGPDESCGH